MTRMRELVGGAHESAVIEALCCEVDEQSTFESRCLQVVQDLGLVGGRQVRRCLTLDDHCFVTNEIRFVVRVEELSFVMNLNFGFAEIGDATLPKLNLQRVLIDLFQKPAPQL